MITILFSYDQNTQSLVVNKHFIVPAQSGVILDVYLCLVFVIIGLVSVTPYGSEVN
jgi:hypothetical protein